MNASTAEEDDDENAAQTMVFVDLDNDDDDEVWKLGRMVVVGHASGTPRT